MQDSERSRHPSHLYWCGENSGLPLNHDLDQYDYSFRSGIGKQQLMQLRECVWLEQNYNIVLMGPSGIGKKTIAAGICFDALNLLVIDDIKSKKWTSLIAISRTSLFGNFCTL